MSTQEDVRAHKLDSYYKEVHATLLPYQSSTLGLFPRGKSCHARVRDNVYCASALWTLSLAYRHVGDDKGRTHELEQSAIKCMRGLLFCYMRQADKVERFKKSTSWEDAIHSRFHVMSGDPVVDHNSWGHLQIDATSLFLLILSQMTAADAQVIFTMDEVDFVQNLVYYVERAYRIPDYGMWERGSRDNVGRRELHASSIGMAKAALEAINGLNLFGSQGSSLSIIHVDPDAHYRNCVILSNLLPRESTSKETDASLLMVAGYPAFAIDDRSICQQTEERTKQLLGPDGIHGTRFGFKRFPRDGHHTVREDRSNRFYNPEELSRYEGIECEWPLFYLIVILTEYCRGNKDEADVYWERLEKCLVLQQNKDPATEDWMLVPRLFYVSQTELQDDSHGPPQGSLKMEPLEEDTPFLWAQALYLVARLTREDLVVVSDLDPLGLRLPPNTRQTTMTRHLGFKPPGHDTVIQVALISETTRLQAILGTHGIPTQTQKQVEPIKIRPPGDILLKVFQSIGANSKLGLSGRPGRPIGALGTSKLYRILGQMVVFLPTDSNVDFYISFDVMMLIDLFTCTMSFLNLNWNMSGRPTVCIYLTEARLKGNNFRKFINFLAQVKRGVVDGVKVRLSSLQALIPTSHVENLEVSTDEGVDKSLQKRLHTPPRRTPSGQNLCSSSSSVDLTSHPGAADDFDVFMVENTEIQQLSETNPVLEVEPQFSQADLKNYSTEKILEALTEVNHDNQLGHLYIIQELRRRGEQYRINTDEMVEEVLQSIYEEAGEEKHWKTVRLAAALLQKVVDSLAPSLTSMLVRGKEVSIGVFGCSELVISEPMSPVEIVKVMYEMCLQYDQIEPVLQQEIMIYLGEFITGQYHYAFNGMIRIRIGWIIQALKIENTRLGNERGLHQLAPSEVKQLLLRVLLDDETRKPLDQRQLDGALTRVPPDFYVKVFGILKRIRGGIIVRDKQLPQLPIVHEMDASEKRFALRVEELLSNITFPEYRQVIVELLMVVSTVLERNPEVNISGSIDLDELLQDAMATHSRDKDSMSHDEEADGSNKVASFYALYPDGQWGSSSYIARAVVNKVLQEGLNYDPSKSCTVS